MLWMNLIGVLKLWVFDWGLGESIRLIYDCVIGIWIGFNWCGCCYFGGISWKW